MPRTTVDLDSDVLKDLKQRAAREGTTLSRILNSIARLSLGRPRTRPRALRLPTIPGKPRPGVNVEDREALWDLMDGR